MHPPSVRRLLTSFTLLLLATTLACAGGKPLTREEAAQRVDAIGQLSAEIEQAEGEGLALLAPKGVGSARSALDDAIASARSGALTEAERFAEKGFGRLEQARQDSKKSAEVLREVLDSRQRAVAAGASNLLPERFKELDGELREAARLAEGGDIEDAQEATPDLLRGYSALELESLKVDATDLARAAIKAAREAGADRYAPDTFARAKKELSIATGILETDRSRVDQANVNALKATELANRSQFVAELVKEFDRRDYDREAVVLWYQSQLEELTSPLDRSVSFDKPNHEAIAEARQQIAEAIEGWRETEAQLTIAQLASSESEKDMREAKARYDRVQSMFSEDEAVVYRRGDDVLLETYGFDFPVGQSEIQSNNFPLLNKIAKAIATFDGPRIVVSGHTDSTGSDDLNLKLSKERAAKVGAFLVEVGELDPSRVETEGFGSSKPVASNSTDAGRARNRRIEIMIVNQ